MQMTFYYVLPQRRPLRKVLKPYSTSYRLRWRVNQYLLLWVDTFTNWVEVLPSRTEKAQEVVSILVSEIIP